MSHPFSADSFRRAKQPNVTPTTMIENLIISIVTTNKGWIVRKAMGYAAGGLATAAAWLASSAEAHGLPAIDSHAVMAASSAAALYIIEAAFSWAAKQVAVR
jgi:hypothetical protein